MGVLSSVISYAEAAYTAYAYGTATDIVAILDEDGNQLFESARITRATIREDSEIMSHPLETGVTISDYVVIKPVEIQFAAVIPKYSYGSTYPAIKDAFTNSTSLIAQTKTGSYENMIISSMPHEENNSQGDAVTIAINLRETKWFRATTETLESTDVAASSKSQTGVTSKQDADTVKNGSTTASNATTQQKEKRSTVLYDIFG